MPGFVTATASATAPPPAAASDQPAGRTRITPNLFSIPFGLTGLAAAWATAHQFAAIAAWPGDVLWILAAVVWLTVLVLYVRDAHGRLAAELRDPIFAPFLSLALIAPMLMGAALSEHWHGPGQVIGELFLAGTFLLGGWTTGTWILEDMTLAQWHPGYFLPTVAGGLLSSEVAAGLGHHRLAELLFGYGVISWLVLGSILLVRLFTVPMVPAPLIPTLAIEVAPPVVAGNAWFALNGGHVDGVALGLAGYALLMVMVQLRLIPLYRTVPFGPAFWAFSFSYAAVFTDAIRWLTVEHPAHARTWTTVLLIVATLALASLAVRTIVALSRRSFLPRPPAARPAA
jgi:tellurite resistance protein